MNLIRRLSEVCPRWREEISDDPIEAALELGLIDEDPKDAVPELDFNQPGAWSEMAEYEDD